MNDYKNMGFNTQEITNIMNRLTYQMARGIKQIYGIDDWVYCTNTAKGIVDMVFVKALKQFRERPVSEFKQIMESAFNDFNGILSLLIDVKKTLKGIITEIDENEKFSYKGKDGKDYYSREELEAANHMYDEIMYKEIDETHKMGR